MDLQHDIVRLGTEIFERMQGEKPSIFNRNFWEGKLLEYVMQDNSFKIDMFRLVDVLPALHTNNEIIEHTREYLLKDNRELPLLLTSILKLASSNLTAGISASQIKNNVSEMAKRFIVGSDAHSAMPKLKQLYDQSIAFSLDVLGESTLSMTDGAKYAQFYLNLIDDVAHDIQHWPSCTMIDTNHAGAIPRANVSIKISAFAPDIIAVDHEACVEKLFEKVRPIFSRAREKNVSINVDLESHELHGITYALFEKIALDDEFRSWPYLGIVVQGYLKKSQHDVERLLALSKKRNCPLSIRLVKGAYWDHEVVLSKQLGIDCPVFINKAETDRNYERLSEIMLQNVDYVWAAFGSHNIRSLSKAMVTAERLNLPKNSFEVQMLYGMAEPERKTLANMGYRVRIYAPVGNLLPGMAYLVRRLLENTANSSFLRLSHHSNVDTAQLLAEPKVDTAANRMEKEPIMSFVNCSFLDFTNNNVRDDFQQAINTIAKTLPFKVPVVIDGKVEQSEKVFDRTSPNDHSIMVSKVCMASTAQCERAIKSAFDAYPSWRDYPLEERANMLMKLADCLEKDRYHLAAMQCFEVAKPWAEADADVAEAIDFCRYYADRARTELAAQPMLNVLGENNVLVHEGRGPTVVIAPWNFPLAIICGMTTATLVSGNPVIMKPAEQSSAIAYALFERMQKVGFPNNVVQFIPGEGEEIGPLLIEHPLVAQVAFTGSKEVGLQVINKTSFTKQQQPELKRVVCEMGGKNAIIVDSDADIDEAIKGVSAATFSFGGQKCSACSRLILVGSVADEFIPRFIERCKSIHIDSATNPSCVLPPVVDKQSYTRLKGAIEKACTEATPLYVGEHRNNGNYVPPAVFLVDDKNHWLMQQELFGPVLAIMKVKSFNEALDVANSTEFALTGAVFSRSPKNLEAARKDFRVGNLYLNQKCTGAMVARQPFGGFKMSGLGTKAGGPSYLLNFVNPRCVTENTTRQGFTPELT